MRKNLSYIRYLMLVICLLPLSLMAQSYADHSVLKTGTWFRMEISSTGIYRISLSEIPNLNQANCSRIAIYGQPGGMLNERNGQPRQDDLRPMPIEMHDHNGNGIFDGNDYLLFYAEGADVWQYDNAHQMFVRQHHSYDVSNYCYLTTTAEESPAIENLALTPTETPAEINTYTYLNYHEIDLTNVTEGGRLWMGEKMSVGFEQVNFSLVSPARSSNTIKTHWGLASVTGTNSVYHIDCNGSTQTINFNPQSHYQDFYKDFSCASTGDVAVHIDYSPYENNAAGYLDFVEMNAEAPLTFTGGQMPFRTCQNSGQGRWNKYRMTGANGNVRIWDVTDYHDVKSLQHESGTFVQKSDEIRQFLAFDGSSFLTPQGVALVENQDLHGAENVDFVIVAHPLFLVQAQQVASLHEMHDGISTLVVTEEQIYNEFSSGKRDPIAIRELLRMMYVRSHGEAPHYLMLFGKGSYDPKDILQNNQPTVITGQSIHSFEDNGSTYATDDIFGYLDDGESGNSGESLDVGIGRIPARNAEEADVVVEKLSHYMNRTDLSQETIRGDWRNYITLLSDDADPSNASDVMFVTSSEDVAQHVQTLYPQYNLDKIYADAYHQQSGAIGSYYPDANNALKQRMDYGCLLLNYIGHGSVEYIGTEQYMTKTDINGYQNRYQLPYFVTSTCSFGRYDKIETPSGAEAFLFAPAAGIACLAASRPIVHLCDFNTNVCVLSLNPDNAIGDALRQAKNITIVSPSITLFGDPALRLSLPQEQVVVTAINDKPVIDGEQDSAEVLSRVTIEGEIRKADGSVDNDFSGIIYPIVFDRATQTSTLANDNEGTEVPFMQQKSILYKGRDSVANGHFSYSFIVPRDVAYSYDFARLSHYAKSANNDATGVYRNLLFGGFNDDIDLSETRPSIRLYLNDSSFRNGGLTNESPLLYAILEDTIGINAVGSGIGHDITALLDDNVNDLLVLNDFYEIDLNDNHRGYVRYYLSDLAPGMHTLTLKAWNIYNYSNSATVNFYVHNDLQQLYAFTATPNPATTHTQLRIEYNQPSMLSSAQMEIYDLMGRKIISFSPQINENSFVVGPVDWDFRTANGQRVPHGIYLVRTILTTLNHEKIVANGKIVLVEQ